MNLREQILAAARQLEKRPVDLGDRFPDGLYVREMTALEMGELVLAKVDDDPNAMGVILAYTLCDEEGVRMFNDPGDALLLGGLPVGAATDAFNTARKLNGMGDEETVALEKNSEDPPT